MSDESSIPQRTCTKCHTPFPATLEYFHKQKNGKYGLSSWCITCHRAVNNANLKERRAADPDLVQRQNEYKKEYRETHREEIAAYNKEYYWSRVKQERERTRIKYKRFESQYRAKRRIRDDKNRESRNAKERKRYANDPIYRLKNRAIHKARRDRKRNNEGKYAYKDIIALYAEQEGRCAYCGITLYIDLPGDITVDHIVALKLGGSNNPENLSLACMSCNSSKKTLSYEQWQSIRQW